MIRKPEKCIGWFEVGFLLNRNSSKLKKKAYASYIRREKIIWYLSLKRYLLEHFIETAGTVSNTLHFKPSFPDSSVKD